MDVTIVMFLLLAITYVLSVGAQRCPHGWLDRSGSTTCYSFGFKQKKSWLDARSECQRYDGDLLKIETDEEMVWVRSQARQIEDMTPGNYEWWTGLNNRGQKDSTMWFWTDGETLKSGVLQWGQGEPNNYLEQEHCAEIWLGFFNDKNCDHLLYFICERPKSAPLSCDVDNGWEHLGGNCYKSMSINRNFQDATYTCSQYDASLVTILNEETQQLVTDLAKQYGRSSWLGLHVVNDWIGNMVLEWMNGKLLEKTWWSESERSNDTLTNTSSCVLLNVTKNGLQNWEYVECMDESTFICTKSPGMCSDGWEKKQEQCYLFFSQKAMTWRDSVAFCNLRGASLIQMNGQDNVQFTASEMQEKFGQTVDGWWIGLSGTNRSWTWLSGDAVDTTGFMWAGNSSQADNDGLTKCAYIRKDDKDLKWWISADCSTDKGVICKAPSNVPVQPPPDVFPELKCQDGWIIDRSNCFKVYTELVTWFEARMKCRQDLADLAVIANEQDQKFLTGQIQQEVWIGLNDRQQEKKFVWLDQNEQVTLTYWRHGDPDNKILGAVYSENCVAMRSNIGSQDHGKWIDYPCAFKLGFVCQRMAVRNIAVGKTAIQSSLSAINVATLAVDGHIGYSLFDTFSCSNTNSDFNPWWEVDLGTQYNIGSVFIHSRTDCKPCLPRLQDLRILLKNDTSETGIMVFQDRRREPPAIITAIVSPSISARYVRIEIPSRKEYLTLCEVEVFEATQGQESSKTAVADMSPSTSAGCAGGWTMLQGTGQCYQKGEDKLTWSDARDACRAWNADLVPVRSLEEGQFLAGIAQNEQNVWLGIRAIPGDHSRWLTVDSSTISFSNWGPGEPDNNHPESEHCAIEKVASRTWHDVYCQRRESYICLKQDQPTPTCSDGWIKNPATDTCYKFEKTYKNWHEAESACQTLNSHLASVSSKEEFNFVTAELKDLELSDDIWIGLHDKIVENKWEWTDGTPFLWSKWAPNQPDDWKGLEDCGGITKYSFINDYFCTIPHMYVCERQAVLSGACDLGWEQDPNTGICFKFADEKKTWKDSRAACQKAGGDLANIKSPDQQLFIYNKVHEITDSLGIWIGASDTTIENIWEGVDGSALTYTDWGPDEPNNSGGKEDCAAIRIGLSPKDGRWNDASCSVKYPYVCQREVSVPTTSPQSKITATLTTIATTKEEKVAPTTTVMTNNSVTTLPTTTMAWDSRCGYLWETSAFEEFCYQINEFQATWNDARMQCQQDGGDLLSITSQSEQSYIAGRLRSKMSQVYWIGANDHGTEGGWGWSNGDPYFYFNWAKGEPNNYENGEDCGSIIAELEESYKWNDMPCNNTFGYICKKHASDKTPNATSATKSPKTSETGSLGCKGDWREYGDKCYLLVQAKTNWKTALKSCRQEGGDLASVANQDEQNFIFSQMPRDYCYDIWTNETQCITWAQRGECEINPVWMSTHCHKTCQLCYHNCSNTYQDGDWCNVWASRGECNKNPTWMIPNCALSCGICYGAPVHGFWIGMSDSQTSKTFQWSDNSKVTFTTWSKAEPNNYNDGERVCVTLGLQTGLWGDEHCSNDMPGYICKMEKISLAFTSPSLFAVGCPYDNSLGYGPFCYLFEPHGKSWNNAQEYCVKKGGNLAVITDGHTQAFLSSELVNKLQNYWIGLIKNNDTKIYQWVNGEAVTYTLWNKDFTGNENVSCVSMRTYRPFGLWEIEDCSSILPFICQIQRDGFTQPSRTTTSLTTIQVPCLSGWTPRDKFCYKMSSNRQSWFEALSSCRRQGADLVSITDAEEATLIKSLVRSSGRGHIWVGLNDLDEENSYKWSDGSAKTYTKWQIDEPNDHNGQEDCVEYYLVSNTWNDNNCYKALAYICKQPRGMGAPATDVMETTTTTEEEVKVSCGMDLPWNHYKGNCYYISSNSVTRTWHAARVFCVGNGAELASIHSEMENNIIFNKVSELDSRAWIGLNELSFRSSLWTDRTSVDFVNWATNEPDHENYMVACAAMTSGGGVWSDENCHGILPFVCKRPIGVSNVTSLPPTQATVGGCLPDFFAFGSKCFLIQSTSKYDWIVAKTACTIYGPGYSLASINSRLEQVALTLRMRETGASSSFIGLNDLDANGKYDWLDNSPVHYSNFRAGEPSEHAMEYCVEMYPDGTWNNLNCASMRGFICQGHRDSSLPEVTPTVPTSDCPADFTMYAITEQCYKILNSTQSWNESLALCQAEGASLATIVDFYDMFFLELLSATNAPDAASIWIGLTDIKEKGDFEWINGAPVTYTNWDYGEPKLQDNMCVTISEGFWRQDPCNGSHPAICQTTAGKSVNASRTTTPSNQLAVCRNSSMISFGGKCYLVVLDMLVVWSTASDICRDNGMQIASVHSHQESEFIKNQVLIRYPDYHMKSVWIGLLENPLSVQFFGERRFLWVDMTPLNFFNWDDGEPNSEETACVELSAFTGAWYDDDCYARKGFVCKGDPDAFVEINAFSTPTSGKPSVVTQMDIPFGSSVTTFPIKVPPLIHSLRDSHTEHSGLTLGPGQIVGIIIGILGALVVLGVCIYVYVQGRGRAFYVFRKGGFANALYEKDKDGISVETDNARVGYDQ
ncbi:hypothetical protein CHS0354_027082 [Potamilus streckersoni]|uniref:Macrophage mannose receptor 1-like n=1 Tax=Potamilus streckersoni TaxID=2493646 RepID=A0AAE0S067_9BIVA|nr:hypothetical protein CHS0354_027082 [Potamilus streckersoni]